MLEEFVKDCIPCKGPHTRAGEEHKKGVAERSCNPSAQLGINTGVRNEEVKLSQGGRALGKGHTIFCLCFSQSYSIFN